MHPSRLTTASLESIPWGDRITRILGAALQAVEPGAAVTAHMYRNKDHLTIQGRTYDLARFRRVLLVGAGKAGAPMARTAVLILGDHLAEGIIIVKDGYAGSLNQTGRVTILESGHPVPDERGAKGANRIIDLLQRTQEDDLVICLISGGGSALLVSPVEGVSLADLQALTTVLLASGANINEINALRKHLSRIKGGNLARLSAPAQLVTLILSDVVGDPLDVIASGPTVPDPTTFTGANKVLERYHILDHVPPAVIAHLQRGQRGKIVETPKPGDPLFKNVHNVVIGSNRQAAQAALVQAKEEGFHSLLLTTYLQGEARHAGRMLAAITRQIIETGQPLPPPACIVTGGETTVTLRGDGLGGRNQEMALSAVEDLAELEKIALVTLATDGGDGPTDAAGAVVTGDTLERARQADLKPSDYLSRNDSYHFFEPLGDLLKPGPTQTNVNDLAFIFAF